MRGRIFGGVVAVALLGCADVEAPSEPVHAPVYSLTNEHSVSNSFSTHATGAEEVPARDTRAQGQASFTLSDDGSEVHYRLIVANIQNVLQAHIHMAPAGTNGGIVAWLYPAAPPATLIPGRSGGVLMEGVIDDADVINALAGQGVAGLMAAIRAGNTYVNVHTSQFPGGEIRGQID